MDELDQRTIGPVSGGAFGGGLYNVCNDVVYPLPSDTLYGSAGSRSWNPYLGPVSVPGMPAEQCFDPSCTPSIPAASTRAADPSAAGVQGTLEWPVDLRYYQHRIDEGLEYGQSFHGTAGPICSEMDPGYPVQQPESHVVPPYDHQLVPGQQYDQQYNQQYNQQYDYHDAVPTVSPASPSKHVPSGPRHIRGPGMTKEQLAQQDEELHRQSADHLRKISRDEPIAGTKRVKDDDGASPQSAGLSSKHRGRGRKSQSALDEAARGAIDMWTPPTPLTLCQSLSSVAESVSSSSPALHKGGSILSIAGMNHSHPNLFMSHEVMQCSR